MTPAPAKPPRARVLELDAADKAIVRQFVLDIDKHGAPSNETITARMRDMSADGLALLLGARARDVLETAIAATGRAKATLIRLAIKANPQLALSALRAIAAAQHTARLEYQNDSAATALNLEALTEDEEE